MAPPAVVYIVAAVVGVAAVFAFKEFVYEPHIAPTLEAWAEDFLERRRAARSRRASAVPVGNRRRSSSSSNSPSRNDRSQRDRHESERSLGLDAFSVDEFELEALVSKEVDDWRNAVLRSQERTQDGLRKRKTNRLVDDFDGFDSTITTLDESFTSLTHTPLASTHVISNVSSPLTPSTASLPQTPTRRFRSESRSTTTQGDSSTPIRAPHSPIHEISPRAASPVPTALTPRPPTDSASQVDTASSSPVAISTYCRRSPATEDAPRPLPFTPTYQVIADDSPFGPLLPDIPRSGTDMYGERPFSPITRVMGSSSDASSAGSRTTLSSSVNSTCSSRTLGNFGMVRNPNGLVSEVVTSGSEAEDHPHASISTFDPANESSRTDESVISSLSERYPAPLTPPVIVSPPTSSIGVISAPSSPHSSSSEVMVHHDTMATQPYIFSSNPQTHPSLPLLRLPPDPSSPAVIPSSRSSARSPISPALSYASFLSPMPMSPTVSEPEGDEFLSVTGDDSDWSGSPIIPSRDMGPVQDKANNPFLDFEHLTHGARAGGSERGDESESSEVLVSEPGQDGGSEVGSDESWGSAKRQ